MGWHGHYDNYCYLPLYIFAGDQLLCARLRPANQDAAAGSVQEVSRIVAQLRRVQFRVMIQGCGNAFRPNKWRIDRTTLFAILHSGEYFFFKPYHL